MCPANFAATNPRGAARGARDARREPDARPRQPARRRAQAPHQPDRRSRVRGRPQPRGHAGRRGVRERADPADPVPADHRAGRGAAAGDGAAVHQQVLHPRPAARELVRRARGGERATRCSWCPGATSRPEQGQFTWDDYLEEGVFAALRVAKEIAKSDQVNALGFCVGGTLLGAALAVLAQKKRRAGRERDVPRRDARFLRAGADRPVRRRGERRGARGDHRRRRHPAGAGSRLRVLQPARQRPGLALRGEQLPARRAAGGLRPALLERRQHQPARADVLLLPAQHLPREQAARARRADQLRRAGRPRQGEAADLRARDARGPHRAVALGLPHARLARRRGQDVRARRERAHRRRGQSGGEEPAQPLDWRRLTRQIRRSGFRKRRNTRAAGGRSGREWLGKHGGGSRKAPAKRRQRASTSRSSPRPAAT